MCQLIESLCLENGIIKNIDYHNLRMNKSRYDLFGCHDVIDIAGVISLPQYAKTGMWKIRIIYSAAVDRIEYEEYKRKTIRSFQIVFADDMDYSHKYLDRTHIAQLLETRNDADDIIIIKEGFVTDSSSANIVLYDGQSWITPASPLLHGTKRAKLLHEKLITERLVALNDIPSYTHISIINAFLDIGDIAVPTSAVNYGRF